MARLKKTDSNQESRDHGLLVKDTKVWTGRGFNKGSILIQNGRIQQISRHVEGSGTETIDASELYAFPGPIDVHVHMRDMGLSYKEDFATGTAAAAAGGFTTVMDMPNTLPPTISAGRLLAKQKEASGKIHVNVGFHAAAVSDLSTINEVVDAGAFSLKMYMPKPIARFNVQDDEVVRKMMQSAARAKIPVTVHAENMPSSTERTNPTSFQQLADSRPPILETQAVERILRIQTSTRCKVHFCHLTLASSLAKIRAASPSTTSEATPHHLFLSDSALRKLGWKAWMVPPLRGEAERRALLASTSKGLCDVVASDHAPHTIKEKQSMPKISPPGVPGLETTLPIMLTLLNNRAFSISRLIRLMVENPARIFNLRSKGRLRAGYDADLVLVDLRKRSRIDSSKFFSKAKFSPFDGFRTKGAVVSTIVGGKLVYHQGEIVTRGGSGTVLRSNPSA